MDPFPKLFLILGIVCIGIGLFWHFTGSIIPLGKLPGDFAIDRGSFKFYFPLTTSIIISIFLTLLFWLMKSK